MASEVKSPKRRYHSPLRADQAQQTRRKIIEAAFGLFADQGYARTTIAQVADLAGVSPRRSICRWEQTRLLDGVIDSAITGDQRPCDPGNLLGRDRGPAGRRRERLGRMVEYGCRVLARTRPIHARYPRSGGHRGLRRRAEADDGCTIDFKPKPSASGGSSQTTFARDSPSPRRVSATASWRAPTFTTCSLSTWGGPLTSTANGSTNWHKTI